MRRYLLPLALVPLLDLYLLVVLGRLIGGWPTLALVVFTAVIGASMAKREGLRVLEMYRATLAQGRIPEEGVLEAVLVLVGGVLLVIPGLISDLVGLCLLIPGTRRFAAKKVQSRLATGAFRRTRTVEVTSFGKFGGVTPEPPSEVSREEDRWRNAARKREQRTEETEAEIVDDPGRR